jgi:predicted lipid-binding transport protein (Tim44 family)
MSFRDEGAGNHIVLLPYGGVANTNGVNHPGNSRRSHGGLVGGVGSQTKFHAMNVATMAVITLQIIAILASLFAWRAIESVSSSRASRLAEEAAARSSSFSLHHSIAAARRGLSNDSQLPVWICIRTEDSP